MRVEIALPSLGDDADAVTGGEVSQWLVPLDAELREGDDLLELTTDKAAFTVPAPQSGRLVEWLVAEGDAVEVGQAIAVMETGE